MKGDAVAETCDRPEIVKKVLILYTGGTVGMRWTGENGKHLLIYSCRERGSFASMHNHAYELLEELLTLWFSEVVYELIFVLHILRQLK